MSMQGPKTHELYQKALKNIPYGVNSNFRYWGPDDTMVIKKGQGAYIWDMDDKRYVDYRLAFGPIILGHADARVNQAVAEAIQNSTLFAWTTPAEIELAERICRMTGIDKVRLSNTGTEAVMHTLRIARAFTGREKFIKFEGTYHGMCDYFLFGTASSNAGMLNSRRSTSVAPVSSGIPKGIAEYCLMIPFNDFDPIRDWFIVPTKFPSTITLKTLRVRIQSRVDVYAGRATSSKSYSFVYVTLDPDIFSPI